MEVGFHYIYKRRALCRTDLSNVDSDSVFTVQPNLQETHWIAQRLCSESSFPRLYTLAPDEKRRITMRNSPNPLSPRRQRM